jgi:hypothetical protein
MTGKRSPAKEQTALQRQRKLATALRTNLRRRKAQASHHDDDRAEVAATAPASDDSDQPTGIDPNNNQA